MGEATGEGDRAGGRVFVYSGGHQLIPDKRWPEVARF